MIKHLLRWLGGRRPAPPRQPPLPLRTLEDLEAVIEEAGASSARGIIHRRALPAFHLVSKDSPDTIGATRLGGLPDLPPGSEWPAAPQGEKLEFLVQLDLADIAHRCGPTVLPQSGLLSLFADVRNLPITGAGAVLLTPAGSALVRTSAPEEAVWRRPALRTLNPVGLAFEAALTLPIGDLCFNDAIEAVAPDCYFDAIYEIATPEGRIGQLLGHADGWMDHVQSALAMDELGYPGKWILLQFTNWDAWEDAKRMKSKLANGLVIQPWSEEDDNAVRWIIANRDRIAAEAEQWQLLLQIDSNSQMDMWLDHDSPLYVFIRTEDLKAGKFSRIHVRTN